MPQATRSGTALRLGHYDYTWTLSRSRWAWEFLRRNSDFLNDAAATDPGSVLLVDGCSGVTLIRLNADQIAAERWGLAFFPDTQANALEAPVFWSSALYPRQMSVQVVPRLPDEVDAIVERTRATCHTFHLTDRSGREHLLIQGKGHTLQVECTGHSLMSLEPVRAKVILDSVGKFSTMMELLDRARIMSDPDYALPCEPQWNRSSLSLRNALVALDVNADGGSYFDTACVIYGEHRAEEAWASASRAMKDEMRRALARGRALRDGAYVDLLRPEQ